MRVLQSVGDEALAPDETARRLGELLRKIDLDCAGRDALGDCLTRLAADEGARERRQALDDAQRARTMIASLVAYLHDLDQIAEDEGDRSVFGHFADLFDTIAAEAARGAAAARGLEHS